MREGWLSRDFKNNKTTKNQKKNTFLEMEIKAQSFYVVFCGCQNRST